MGKAIDDLRGTGEGGIVVPPDIAEALDAWLKRGTALAWNPYTGETLEFTRWSEYEEWSKAMAKKTETPTAAESKTSQPATITDLKSGEIGRVVTKAVRRGDRENLYVERAASISEAEGIQVRRNGLGQLEINRWTVNLNALDKYAGPKDEWEYAHLS